MVPAAQLGVQFCAPIAAVLALPTARQHVSVMTFAVARLELADKIAREVIPARHHAN